MLRRNKDIADLRFIWYSSSEFSNIEIRRNAEKLFRRVFFGLRCCLILSLWNFCPSTFRTYFSLKNKLF